MDDAKLQKNSISEMRGGVGKGGEIRTLFCDVKSLRTVRIVISASEEFAQDGIISTWQNARVCEKGIRRHKGSG